jgi:GntR family transcriptional repressor for pyruvate dehydrogenase complex
LQLGLDLAGKSVEERRELLFFHVIRLASRYGHAGQFISQVGQSDRPQVGVLDGPPVALGRGNSHAQCDAIAFPRYDDRMQAPVPGGVLFDRAGDNARGTVGCELDDLFVHWKLWYTGPVIEPLEKANLTSARQTVKRFAHLRDGETRLIEPIKKTRIAEEVADRIRTLILDGTFPPGRPLPSERVLTERFGVSRGSIRDALRMLEMIGLLETRHGQGTFPHELTVDRLVAPLASVMTYRHDLQDELLDVRRMFEPAVARVAAARVTDEDFADLHRILEAQRRKLKTGRSAIVEDTAFHAALARSTRNRVVVSIMTTLNDLLVESRTQALKQKGRPEKSIEGHEAVVAALRSRDAEAAGQAMYKHIDQISDLQLHTYELPDNPDK